MVALFYLGGLITLIGAIWLLVVAFKKSIWWGLGSLLIPFVSLIFVILNWQDSKKPFLIQVAGVVLCLVGGWKLGSMAGITAALYALQATAAVASGWGSDLLIRAGHSSTLIRKGFVIAGMAGTAVLFGGAAVTNGTLATIMLVGSGFTVGLSGTMVFTIGQTLAGPRAGGRWMGFQNMVGNLSGIAAPIVTGLVVDWSGSFGIAFLVAAALSAVGIMSWLLIVPKIQAVEWTATPAVATPRMAALHAA